MIKIVNMFQFMTNIFVYFEMNYVNDNTKPKPMFIRFYATD